MSEPAPVPVGGRSVGPGQPCFVIAELSANHGGSLERALELTRAAADAGADAVKLQHYTADDLTLDLDTPPFRISGGTLWDERTLHELYRSAATPWEWFEPVAELATERGLVCFSSPFSPAAVRYLAERGAPALKIASFELVDHELLVAAAATGLPLLLSTGMATDHDIDDAVALARGAGAEHLLLLRCNSSYPAPVDEMDLRTIPDMARRWQVPVGLSDHTLDDTAAVVAVALGACALEVHLTLHRHEPTADAAFSREPHELSRLVGAVRAAEAALGSVRYGPSPAERASLVFRRSLFVVADVAAGEPLAPHHVRAIRPGTGLHPRERERVLGRRARGPIVAGTPLSWDLLEPT